MPSHVVRTGLILSVGLVCLFLNGCYVPGGGWTMRTGLDCRRYKKPSLFVEMVDTRWDEYNRVAEMNVTGGLIDPRSVVTPTALPPGAGVGPIPPGSHETIRGPLPPANGLPPAVVPAPTETGPSHGEPHQLPGAPDESAPPPEPGANGSATARRPQGPTFLPAPAETSGADAPARQPVDPGSDAAFDDSDNDDEDIELSSYRRTSGGRSQKTGFKKKPLQKPTASRLFGK